MLFGMRALHRNQTQGSFAFVWNAMLNWDSLDVGIADATPAVTAEIDQHGH